MLPFSGPVPRDGAFAVLSIVPDASLAYLNDPEALLACKELFNKNYAIYVPGVDSSGADEMSTVNFTHDLSMVQELNYLGYFFKEVEQLERIARHAKKRPHKR
ncbi:hypothetical protein C8R44DRAFT_869519 [Mycena epipterygia]|nr:hypothetical protein C8R44DRAFT_869519 [Mycena epipterygia]